MTTFDFIYVYLTRWSRFLINLRIAVDRRILLHTRGWSGAAMVLGKLPVPGRPTILSTVGQGPIALAVGAGGGGLEIFTLIYPFFSFSLSLGDGPIWTEICLKGPLNPKQPTNQITSYPTFLI